jgi:hypothetical protein
VKPFGWAGKNRGLQELFLMPNDLTQKVDHPQKPAKTLVYRYEGEDTKSFLVSDPNGARFNVPKNRIPQEPLLESSRQTLKPAFRLLALAFLGLAPAGLGTLVLAPLAAVWALAILITRPLAWSERLRVYLVWGIAAVLLGISIPLSSHFLERLVL